MYELRVHRKVDKELSYFPQEVRSQIKTTFLPLISVDPKSAGRRLSGNMSGYWRFDFRESGVDYRIAYEVDEEEKVVYILMVGKRERFYKRLRRLLL
jgi:mRNA-degrading endonuclease RelE of RelBE toxin-antitoxin system